MKFASLDYAFSGLAGSNKFTSLKNTIHPIQQKRIDEIKKKKEKQEQEKGKYICYQNGEPCNDIVERNYIHNERQKEIAKGTQFHPENRHVLAPQYPWVPEARHNFLSHGYKVNDILYYPQLLHDMVKYKESFTNSCDCSEKLFKKIQNIMLIVLYILLILALSLNIYSVLIEK